MLDGLPTTFLDEMNDELIKPLSCLENFQAIEGMVDGRALGHDGIPIDFFKKCWSFIEEEFSAMIIQALECGEFHRGMTKGVISLIPKDGNSLDLDHWRPITLLTVMYKIFAKPMQLRLQPKLMEVISL